jgi:ribosome biogenesis protein YTM1
MAATNLKFSFGAIKDFTSVGLLFIEQHISRLYSIMASTMDENNRPTSASDEEDVGEQIRVSFLLDSSVSDRTLEVPSAPIAIPASLRRKGLSSVINHLLDRVDEDEDNDESDEDKLKALPFDFLVGNRLLRTGVESTARRHGLSLEKAIQITYFPAQQAPELSGEGETEPDWISAMTLVNGDMLCSGGYDGSLVVHNHNEDLAVLASVSAHTGPIKCIAAMNIDTDALIATGSLDQTLVTHRLDRKTREFHPFAEFVGHTASVNSVDILVPSQKMASGDWNGGLCLWDLSATESDVAAEEPAKKAKTGLTGATTVTDSSLILKPLVSFQAHSSNISGISWGNSPHANGKTLVTGSWDHSLKVWDMDRQDCLLTLNGSRVVTCLDSSYHSEVVATGHPDCTIRLWDVRVNNSGETSSLVSDSSLKPSHNAWVSAVRWSRKDPYVLASSSHDGTIKIWDIRSPLPLHTVRAHPKGEKSLCLAFGDGIISSGGTDCVVKQYRC